MIPASFDISAAMNSVAGPASSSQPQGVSTNGGSAGDAFSSALNAGLNQATHLEAQAQSTVMDMLRGGGVEVHDAMIATQQSELTFELALQVRNKAVAAYQQMMQMQF